MEKNSLLSKLKVMTLGFNQEKEALIRYLKNLFYRNIFL